MSPPNRALPSCEAIRPPVVFISCLWLAQWCIRHVIRLRNTPLFRVNPTIDGVNTLFEFFQRRSLAVHPQMLRLKVSQFFPRKGDQFLFVCPG